MFKKIVLGTLLVGMIGTLTFGAITRTIAKTERATGTVTQGLGQGLNGGRGRTETDIADNHSEEGLGFVQGRDQGQGGGDGQDQGNGEGRAASDGDRQYKNNIAAPEGEGWEIVAGSVAVVPGEDIDLVIETADSELQIGTGPNWMATQGYVLTVGEQVEVSGYWQDGEFKAGTITRPSDGASITLRDQDGRPAWAGQGRRSQANATSLH